MGEATAELFAAEGARVAVADIQVERGQQIVARIAENGGEAVFCECDVAQEELVRDAIDQTVARFGSLHIAVNCAGVVVSICRASAICRSALEKPSAANRGASSAARR